MWTTSLDLLTTHYYTTQVVTRDFTRLHYYYTTAIVEVTRHYYAHYTTTIVTKLTIVHLLHYFKFTSYVLDFIRYFVQRG